VAIACRNDLRWYETVHAALRIGAIVVPVNLQLPAAVAVRILDDAGAAMAVVDEPRRRTLVAAPLHRALWSIDGTADGARAFDELYQPAEPLPWAVTSDDAAVIAYTSGTTGPPKGVVLTHGGLLGLAGALAVSLGWGPATRYLHAGSLSYTAGVTQAIIGISAVGGTLVLEDEFTVERLLTVLNDERITAWHGLPLHWDALRRSAAARACDFSRLTSAITGGGATPADLFGGVGAMGIPLRHVYGMTEAGGTIAMATDTSRHAQPGSVGVPLLHAEVRVVRRDGSAAAPGELGEVLVRTAAMMREYWGRPAETAAMLVDGWLRTGDVGRVDAAGLLWIVDRRANGIRRGAHTVYPGEVERALLAVDGVREAVLVDWDGPTVVTRLADGADDAAVVAALRAALSPADWPERVICVDAALPRSQTGKVLRHEVLARLGERPAG
jgi:fatty-acyl-CoA synthase